MERAHMPATTIQSALICSPRDKASTARETRPSKVTKIQSSFFQRLIAIKVPEGPLHASPLSGSALVPSLVMSSRHRELCPPGWEQGVGLLVSAVRRDRVTVAERVPSCCREPVGNSRRTACLPKSQQSLFRRDAETSTRDECATRDAPRPAATSPIHP